MQIQHSYRVAALHHQPLTIVATTPEEAASDYATDIVTMLPAQLTCAVSEDGKLVCYVTVEFTTEVTIRAKRVTPPACHEAIQ